jgi:ABC-type sulfate transport system permease subunit
MFHLPAMFTTAGVTCTFIIRSTIPIISKLMLHHLFLT